MTEKVFQLSGTCNNYSWGKQGRQSLAAQLAARTPGFSIHDGEYYSELWFGDYPDYPARLLSTGERLQDVLKKNKDTLLGKKVTSRFDAQLPFLPKILSIAKALPLQIHPSKDLAAKLHEKDPDNFSDPNHKPEIAVALSKFEVFAGFKPLGVIEPLFRLPALRAFVPDGTDRWTDNTLKEVVRKILTADELSIRGVQEALGQTRADRLGDARYIHDLLPRLRDQYGDKDPGNLVALLTMNFLVLSPGEALFIPADGIHAYLAGDIVECMARSNNVLNTGFCPAADRNNADMFVDALSFAAHSREDVYLPSKPSGRSKTGRTVVYSPPMPEFDLLKASLRAGERDDISAGDGPGVLIVTQGKGTMQADGETHELAEGFIYFVAPGVKVEWETETGMQIHMAVV